MVRELSQFPIVVFLLHGIEAWQRPSINYRDTNRLSPLPKAWFLVLGCNRQDGKGEVGREASWRRDGTWRTVFPARLETKRPAVWPRIQEDVGSDSWDDRPPWKRPSETINRLPRLFASCGSFFPMVRELSQFPIVVFLLIRNQPSGKANLRSRSYRQTVLERRSHRRLARISSQASSQCWLNASCGSFFPMVRELSQDASEIDGLFGRKSFSG